MNGRHLIFVPEINPNSFVFFYVLAERSYSIREYLHHPPAKVRYADEFPYAASEVCRMATRPGNHFFEGERHNTKDFMYWQQTISELNEKFLSQRNSVAACTSTDASDVAAVQPRYPLLNQAELMRLPKAGKRQDMQRILESPNSEDYVTWNAFQLLGLSRHDWWSDWLKLACSKNPLAVQGLVAEDVPKVHLWQCVQSPVAYERASRRRMAASSIPEWVRRAVDPSAVEGASEIDVALKGKQYVIYIEAKLGSDISTRTTYDPGRNQIVRNIDCLIEGAGGRTPLFWMIARDDAPTRSYMQVINTYRSDPALLSASLPHRNKAALEQIANRITVFLWRELLKLTRRPDDPDDQRVWNEVWNRI